MIPKKSVRAEVIGLIANSWNVSPDRLDYFLSLYKPGIQTTSNTFSIGRISLPIVSQVHYSHQSKRSFFFLTKLIQPSILSERRRSNFAFSRHSLVLLEKIAASVHMGEPVLLVGETGTGKTTVIQYLADQLGQKLIVQVFYC
jgi:midasin